MSFVVEMFRFLMARKKIWLFPLVLALVLIGGLLVIAQGSILAPFIYALF